MRKMLVLSLLLSAMAIGNAMANDVNSADVRGPRKVNIVINVPPCNHHHHVSPVHSHKVECRACPPGRGHNSACRPHRPAPRHNHKGAPAKPHGNYNKPGYNHGKPGYNHGPRRPDFNHGHGKPGPRR